MNFNLHLQVEKVMNKLAESKDLRTWTYAIGFLIIIGIGIWQLAPIIQALVKLIEVLN